MTDWRPIEWDGRERTAERILWALPDLLASTWGGAPGKPREVFIRTRRNAEWQSVRRGEWIVADQNGKPRAIPSPPVGDARRT